MQRFLPVLSFLCATQVHSIFDGACPRKDPPPGVLVVSLGSNLVLTCEGHVLVDGVKVNIARKTSNTMGGGGSPIVSTTMGNIINNKHTADNIVNQEDHSDPGAEVRTVTQGSKSPRYTPTAYKSSPTAHMVRPTSTGRLLKGESNWVTEGGGGYEEDKDEEQNMSRITRGINSRPQWKWNERTVGSGTRDWGGISFERRGATLSLSSVRVTDSGKYACDHRGRERFSLKVTIAEPPENPRLSCYKKSPSSKIRCEWVPQKPVMRNPNCHLMLNKSPSQAFFHHQCSYSSRHSRCWCALEHNEDEQRTLHTAFLCVTNIAGNATSNLEHFEPLDILKPDPPSDVKVIQLEGHKTWIKVTWYFPTSWKIQDRYYELKYQIKYRPLNTTLDQEQVMLIHEARSHIIKDAISGTQYLIQLRAKDEYDGMWSAWSKPIKGSSWTAPADNKVLTLDPTEEGSTGDDNTTDADPGPDSTQSPQPAELSHVLWIFGSFVFLSAILVVYIFRHKDKLMSKMQSINISIWHLDSSEVPPSAPAAPEEQALVTFKPPCYKEPPASKAQAEEGENDEERRVRERLKAMHFNNSSYFFIQRE